MSAIADFRLIETSKLNDLRDNSEIKVQKKLFSKRTIDNYWDYLNANSKKLPDLSYSGYIFGNLLVFLEERKGVDLLKSEHDEIANAISHNRQTSIFILTFHHKQNYLVQLSADKYTVDELIAFNKDFSEDDDPELANAEIEGIKALRNSLELLTDDQYVVLLNVG